MEGGKQRRAGRVAAGTGLGARARKPAAQVTVVGAFAGSRLAHRGRPHVGAGLAEVASEHKVRAAREIGQLRERLVGVLPFNGASKTIRVIHAADIDAVTGAAAAGGVPLIRRTTEVLEIGVRVHGNATDTSD